MVGATGFEPVIPAVSRQWPVFVSQTHPTNQRSFFPSQSFSNKLLPQHCDRIVTEIVLLGLTWYFKGGTPKKHSRARLTRAPEKILANFQTYLAFAALHLCKREVLSPQHSSF